MFDSRSTQNDQTVCDSRAEAERRAAHRAENL